ncbi:MAG: sulfatase-like hydrolase/transferase [Holophagales bacterium]|nr:sulfatase-like hydrolase/transferase [Holophagales bacterium]MYD20924.1 sulfatase-like hydrolase/transferase [Holophagales bacterium]MYI33317.1 sulfatase-like hydrolase/transferase [Holophagales bacterium]
MARAPAWPLLWGSGALALTAACSANPPAESPGPDGAGRPERPNIVLIVADDLGYGDLGSYGSSTMRTPRLDRLAAEGVRFTAAYAAAAVCSPSRAGLITGRYPQRHGYEFNLVGRDLEFGLAAEERTLGDLMRGAGYATGYFGKWHLGRSADRHPLSRGFDEFVGVLGGASGYFDAIVHRGRETARLESYLTDALTAEAAAFVGRHAAARRPFFLVLSYTAPHTPLQATPADLEAVAHVEDGAGRTYAAMVSSVDRGAGALLDHLASHGVDRDTLVVFTSDNGCVGYLDVGCSNAPFSGFKRSHLEGGIRVPLIMRWPNGLAGGGVYREPVISLDLFATFAALAGASPDRGGAPGDGVDLLPHLTGRARGAPSDALFWRAGPNRAIRMGRFKLLEINRADPAAQDAGGALIAPPARPVPSPHGQVTLLYDLDNDPAESVNLAARFPGRVRRLSGRLDRWEASLAEPAWPSDRSTIRTIDGELVQLFF